MNMKEQISESQHYVGFIEYVEQINEWYGWVIGYNRLTNTPNDKVYSITQPKKSYAEHRVKQAVEREEARYDSDKEKGRITA